MDNNIHAGHRQRLRNRFDAVEFDGWSEHEILEFLLCNTYRRCDTNEIAHRLLSTFGNQKNVFSASHQSLLAVDEIGEQTAYFIRTVGKVMEYMQHSVPSSARLTKETTESYIQGLFMSKHTEHLYAIFLDSNMKIICKELLAKGDFNHIEYDISTIYKKALNNNARYVILAHNHPSGVLVPSQHDISTTNLISDSLRIFGSKLLEHYIANDNGIIGIFDYLKNQKND